MYRLHIFLANFSGAFEGISPENMANNILVGG